VPYRLTQTNHYLVRVRINGKGPFNFLVDTGAPALYVGTEIAAKIGLEPSKTSFWTDVDRFDIEGGAVLRHV
jgi:predicted aspartyl protease